MTSLELTPEQAAARPLAGRILLELDAPLTMEGLIHIPESAQTQSAERTQLVSARVVAIGYGPYLEGGERLPGIAEGDVRPGDRVLYNPLMKDLNKRWILTSVTRVEAVIQPQPASSLGS